MVPHFYSVLPNKEAGNRGLLKIVLLCTLQAERLPGLPCWEGVWRQEAAVEAGGSCAACPGTGHTGEPLHLGTSACGRLSFYPCFMIKRTFPVGLPVFSC